MMLIAKTVLFITAPFCGFASSESGCVNDQRTRCNTIPAWAALQQVAFGEKRSSRAADGWLVWVERCRSDLARWLDRGYASQTTGVSPVAWKLTKGIAAGNKKWWRTTAWDALSYIYGI